MSDSNSINNILNNIQSLGSTPQRAPTQNLGRDEFLKMLVAQLQNQDPMDPMKGDDFSVNLAQFSQLEQLISINETLGSQKGSTDLNSYAGFLGQEVTINSSEVVVANGDGGIAAFNLMIPASEVKVELVDLLGNVKHSVTLENLPAGRQSVALNGLDVAPGTYNLRVSAKGALGQFVEIPANAAGIVSGFVPGDEPVLLVGDREVKTADILRVSVPGA